MKNSYESSSNGYVLDPGLQIGRHISFKSSGKFSPWFDIRVFYARVSNFLVDDSTPECLTLNHKPLNPDTALEANGLRCSADSEASCVLRRDRVDKKSEEATFVSTDSIRTTGSIKFMIFDREELVISGHLELSSANGLARKWSMNCESAIFASTGFLKGKQIVGSEFSLPTVEVYVAGCFSETPLILTKTLQLKYPNKQRKAVLNSIPEYYASEAHHDRHHDLQVMEYKTDSDEEYNNLYQGRVEYLEDEDGELSWFNAGVRVGVGIGLGICLGIGIGVSLLVRTYHTATQCFGRRLV